MVSLLSRFERIPLVPLSPFFFSSPLFPRHSSSFPFQRIFNILFFLFLLFFVSFLLFSLLFFLFVWDHFVLLTGTAAVIDSDHHVFFLTPHEHTDKFHRDVEIERLSLNSSTRGFCRCLARVSRSSAPLCRQRPRRPVVPPSWPAACSPCSFLFCST